jgi:ATP-dependent helicase/nuclease subunit B
LAGFTRLSIVSFESLARLVLKSLLKPCRPQLSEEGRVMVLRALLAEHRETLKVFRASSRLTGFAQQLSRVLSEVQRAQLSPFSLKQLAHSLPQTESLTAKLEDLSTLLQEYLGWLLAHDLQDEGVLLRTVSDTLRAVGTPALHFESLWVDGFAEFSEMELDLLCALIPCCHRATLTFCLDSSSGQMSWLSHWSTVNHSLSSCHKRLATLPGVEVITETLRRYDDQGRFGKNPVLRHLEECWADPRPFEPAFGPTIGSNDPGSMRLPPKAMPSQSSQAVEVDNTLRVMTCVDREAEVAFAAREILAFVRAGARFRDISVLLRKLDPYHQIIQQVFTRYQIPFFLDRRESISHHPMAELTRSALRVVALGWRHEDWFGALKSGLFPVADEEIDLLENEALARGWRGNTWLESIRLKDIPKNAPEQQHLARLEQHLESVRHRLLSPFQAFLSNLAMARNCPTGPQLALCMRQLWDALQVQQQLDDLTSAENFDLQHRTGLSVHQTVWRQMNAWLDNAELAFPHKSLPLRDWVPILEAGLANLTIGVIPPALDQVLVGSVDRSRTPEVKLALVLGLNETVFPVSPDPGSLLTETDRAQLEKNNVVLGLTARRHVSRENYLAYIALTRARTKLILTSASRDLEGAPLNPSSLFSRLSRLFPNLKYETILQVRSAECGVGSELHSAVGSQGADSLTPEVAGRLYGPVLRSSVSRIEQFAACPFKFFVHSGLRAEERRLFQLDVKEQGTFQHDLLALFHQQLHVEGKRWRDITPAEARERVGLLSERLLSTFRQGLLESSDQTRFTARVLTESLQDFVETLVDWMRAQYRFDPIRVELPFGNEGALPPWKLDLGNGQQLEIYGRIDRVDFHRFDKHRAFCVVVDYKSKHQQLDPVLLAHGLQLQLLTYLNVVRQWPDPRDVFDVDELQPVGVFYVNLRGKYARERNRIDALANPEQARKLAYRHCGRFDVRALQQLDSRSHVREGDQFNYRLTNSGRTFKTCKEALSTPDFQALLAQVQTTLRTMGQQIYAGQAGVAPYRKGAITACDQCAYHAICRVDPWTQKYRVLQRLTSGDSNCAAEEDPT